MPRAEDERVLLVLDCFAAGYSHAKTARVAGLHRNAVSKIIKRVCAQDIAYDPEAAAYWHTKGYRA